MLPRLKPYHWPIGVFTGNREYVGVISEAAGYRSGMAVRGLVGVFGVASGLAEYFGVPPIVVQAAFVIATFLSILGLIAYFILGVWMPKRRATD